MSLHFFGLNIYAYFNLSIIDISYLIIVDFTPDVNNLNFLQIKKFKGSSPEIKW